MIFALIVMAVVIAGLSVVVVLQGRQLRDMVDNQAHQQADLVQTLVNASVTRTPAEFIQAQKVTNAVDTGTPRQNAAAISREQFQEEMDRRIRALGYEPPDYPEGLGA